MIWAGIDVGSRKNGFHGAAIDACRLVAGPVHEREINVIIDWLRSQDPALVAVDCPIGSAPSGSKWRDCEREINRHVCGIRWTPDLRALESNPDYYGWILNGLRLYAELNVAGLNVVECYPTASLTRWGGSRGTRSRARWSREIVEAMSLEGLPARMNQHARDAVVAALTARSWAAGAGDAFGPIVLPKGPVSTGSGVVQARSWP